MSFVSELQNKVIDAYQQQHFQIVKGQVKEYDSDSNRAHVYINDPKNGEEMLLYNVPVELSGVGVTSAGPFSGDQVYVAFVNGSLVQPKVIGRSDETFYYYTRSLTKHERKGAYLTEIMSDLSSFDETEPTTAETSSSSEWIDSSNDSVLTYSEFSGDALTQLQTDIASAPYYALAEIGLTHPLNTSTVKIRDNGIIDAFVGTNCGIRIAPTSKTLLFLSSIENHHASSAAYVVDSLFTVDAGGMNRQRSQSYLVQTQTGTISAEVSLLVKSHNLLNSADAYHLTYQTMIEKGTTANRTLTTLTDNVSTVNQTYQTLTQEVSKFTGTYASQTLEVSGLSSLKANHLTLEGKGGVVLKGSQVSIEGDSVKLDSSHLSVGNGGTITFSGTFEGDFGKEVVKIMKQEFGALFNLHHSNADHSKWMN